MKNLLLSAAILAGMLLTGSNISSLSPQWLKQTGTKINLCGLASPKQCKKGI